MVKRKVVWDELARTALKEAYNHIKQDSYPQAEKVKQEIIATSKKLADHPEMYLPINTEKIKMHASALLRNIIIAYPTLSQKTLFEYCVSAM